MFQPPKKKGTKTAKVKTSTVVDGLSTEDMSKEQVKLVTYSHQPALRRDEVKSTVNLGALWRWNGMGWAQGVKKNKNHLNILCG